MTCCVFLSDDEEVVFEEKPAKKRVEILWNELKFEFSWRVGTPEVLLVVRLARMLDPLADASRLLLTFSDGRHAIMDDSIESNVSLHATFQSSEFLPLPQRHSAGPLQRALATKRDSRRPHINVS